MDALERSIEIALEAHKGAKYGEDPYVYHPIRMALRAVELGFGEDVQVVALLHDVLEDGPPKTQLDALTLVTEGAVGGFNLAADLQNVTKRKGETYADFIARAASRRVSLIVKLLDLEHHIRYARDKRTRGMVRSRYAKHFFRLVDFAKAAGITFPVDARVECAIAECEA